VFGLMALDRFLVSTAFVSVAGMKGVADHETMRAMLEQTATPPRLRCVRGFPSTAVQRQSDLTPRRQLELTPFPFGVQASGDVGAEAGLRTSPLRRFSRSR